MMFQDCIDELLIRGLDDWMQAAEIASVALSTGGAETEAMSRELSLRLIRELLEDGLAEVGTVTERDGFVPWSLPVDAAMQRILGAWPASAPGPRLGEVCWLSLTPKGEAQAHDLRARGVRRGT